MSPNRPRSAVKSLLINLVAATLPALLLLAVLLEVAVRLLLPVSDVPDVTFSAERGNRFAPHQTGLHVRGNGAIRAEYRINGAGWNSPYEYDAAKPAGAYRIAVVGDSFVEAFQVDHDQSFPYLLERRLNARAGGRRYQVFSYGHSGANLAQYLNVVRKEVVAALPDLVIVVLVHNDFQEALTGYSRIDNWSLTARDGSWQELAPQPAKRLWLKRLLRHSALARYAIYNLALHQRLFFLKALFQGGVRRFEANVDVELPVLEDPELLRDMLRYVLGELAGLGERHAFDLLLVMDAYRQPIYDGLDPRQTIPHRLNAATAAIGAEKGLEVLDLTEALEGAWKRHRRRFEWEIDHHWNDLGHEIVAEALEDWILAARDREGEPAAGARGG